jgi:branched-chain amino acid transport system permease protein
MDLADRSRSLRTLLLVVGLVLVGVLGLVAPSAAQDGGGAQGEPAGCTFNKRDAIEANGGPLGPSIWGRLCQVKDGKATFPKGVVITVRRDGREVGTATTGADGVFVVTIPGNGTYEVRLDPKTLPSGFSLTDEREAVLPQVSVKFSDQRATFRLGADTRGKRDFSDYATTFAKGLRLGLILSVAAVGLSLVFGVTGLVNFAHAELVTAGAIATYVLSEAGVPFWLAVPLAAGVGAVLGWGTEIALWRPLRRRKMALLSMMVVSIGLGITARNLIQIAFGPDGRRYDAASGQREST